MAVRIGLDARLYFQTGVGVYIRNLIHAVSKIAPPEWQWLVYVCPQDSKQIHPPNAQWIKREVDARWHSFAEQTIFYHALMQDSLDLMHFTYFSYPILYRRPFIATIHDLTPWVCKTGKASTLPYPLYLAKLAVLKFVMHRQVASAACIITPTQTVKNEVLTVFGDSYADKTHVLYEGLSYEFDHAQNIKSMHDCLPERYVLYVGNFYPHKNLDRLIEGFLRKPRKHRLVLMGPENYFAQKLLHHTSGIATIQMVHPTSIDEISTAYSHASALVNPSLSEGFGLPLVEAVSYNLPILASDIAVFRELLGNSYYAFQPHSISSIDEVFSLFEQEVNPRKPMLVVPCSFDVMAKEYISLIQSVLKRQHTQSQSGEKNDTP